MKGAVGVGRSSLARSIAMNTRKLEGFRAGIHPRVRRPTPTYENTGTGRGLERANGGPGVVKAGSGGTRGERF